MITKKEYTLKQEQIDLFEEYKESHEQLHVPKGLTPKKRKAWIDENWLAFEGKQVLISGAGRILLWLAYVNGGLKKYFDAEIKRKNWRNAFEILQFIYREELLGINLEKKLNKENARNLIEELNYGKIKV